MGAASLKKIYSRLLRFHLFVSTFTFSFSTSHLGEKVDRFLCRGSCGNRRGGAGGGGHPQKNMRYPLPLSPPFLLSRFHFHILNREGTHVWQPQKGGSHFSRAPSLKNKTFTASLSHLMINFMSRKNGKLQPHPDKYKSFILPSSHLHSRRWQTDLEMSSILGQVLQSPPMKILWHKSIRLRNLVLICEGTGVFFFAGISKLLY